MAVSEKRLRIDDARHLVQRTGFSRTPRDVLELMGADRRDAIDATLSTTSVVAPVEPPGWVYEPFRTFFDTQELGEAGRLSAGRSIRKAQSELVTELRAWWFINLVRSTNEIGSRMTLFWQNHFTSDARKVIFAPLLYRQHAILIEHALGRLRPMLTKILQDPAMLVYLDNRANTRSRPNENLARELMELFTLGVGNFTERDVKEMARALTGLGTDKRFDFRFHVERHDPGEKTILGVTDEFALDDIVALLLAQPATAELITTKLWRTFISPNPEADQVSRFAKIYRESDYDVRVLLREMFLSDAFWNEAARATIVKSPVDYIVGSIRLLELDVDEPATLIRAAASMQQTFYRPPTVRGWLGGNAWISSRTLLARSRFAREVLRDDELDLKEIADGIPATELEGSIVPASLLGSLEGPDHPVARALRATAYNLC